MRPKRRLTRVQRRALEVLAAYLRGATDDLLIISHGFQTKLLAALVNEGLATALIGDGVEADGKMVEVVRITITDAGRKALEN